MTRRNPDGGYRLPEQLTDHELLCLSIPVPNNREYRAALWGALFELSKWWNWEKDGTNRAKEAADYWKDLLNPLVIEDAGCALLPAPYWDDEDGDDADDTTPELTSPWYEDVADWIVTGFLATTFEPSAAIAFVSTIRKARLLFRARDYGGIVRILIDGIADPLLVDTYSPNPAVIGVDIEALSSLNFRLEHTGTANPAASPVPGKGYAVEVIRKRLSESEIGVISDIRIFDGVLEKLVDGEWQPLDGWRLLPEVRPSIDGERDGNPALTTLLSNLDTMTIITDTSEPGSRPREIALRQLEDDPCRLQYQFEGDDGWEDFADLTLCQPPTEYENSLRCRLATYVWNTVLSEYVYPFLNDLIIYQDANPNVLPQDVAEVFYPGISPQDNAGIDALAAWITALYDLNQPYSITSFKNWLMNGRDFPRCQFYQALPADGTYPDDYIDTVRSLLLSQEGQTAYWYAIYYGFNFILDETYRGIYSLAYLNPNFHLLAADCDTCDDSQPNTGILISYTRGEGDAGFISEYPQQFKVRTETTFLQDEDCMPATVVDFEFVSVNADGAHMKVRIDKLVSGDVPNVTGCPTAYFTDDVEFGGNHYYSVNANNNFGNAVGKAHTTNRVQIYGRGTAPATFLITVSGRVT
jgi:hypothetical protein